mgnify:CR=1 FL=1
MTNETAIRSGETPGPGPHTRVLVFGATGYIGGRILAGPEALSIRAAVRDDRHVEGPNPRAMTDSTASSNGCGHRVLTGKP